MAAMGRRRGVWVALPLMGLAAVGLAACAFVESAAELTFGEPDLPNVAQNAYVDWTSINDLLEESFNAAISGAAPIDNPPTLNDLAQAQIDDDSSWADLRASLCFTAQLGVFQDPALQVILTVDDPEGVSPIKAIVMTMFVVPRPPANDPGGAPACVVGDMGVTVEVEFVPLTAETQQGIKDSLDADLESLKDAILQIRFRFKALEFRHLADPNQPDGAHVAANQRLSSFTLALRDDAIPDDPDTEFTDGYLEVVPFFLLETISPETPERFELDPDSPVTDRLKDSIVDVSGERPLIIEAGFTLDRDQIEGIPFNQSGLALDIQPEVTINGIDALTATL